MVGATRIVSGVIWGPGRVGAITVIELLKDADGTVNEISFDYVVWKSSDDT